MNPQVKYTFKSHKGQDVTITSRMGENAARSEAMLHFWGPPHSWCQNVGFGLSLTETKELVE